MAKKPDEPTPPDPAEAEIAWEGDSLEVLRTFPVNVRREFGLDIRRLQQGGRPLSSRPMQSVGKGVFELKQRDEAGWYRVIYLTKVGNTYYILHSFKKQSAKTSPNDLAIAENRLKDVRSRLTRDKD